MGECSVPSVYTRFASNDTKLGHVQTNNVLVKETKSQSLLPTNEPKKKSQFFFPKVLMFVKIIKIIQDGAKGFGGGTSHGQENALYY